MIIRTATQKDLQAIKELYSLLDADAVYYQPEHFLKNERPEEFILNIIQNDKSDFLLIEEDNHVIGFSLIQEKAAADISCLKQEHYAYLLDLVIAEEYRSRGYGASLMRASKEWGRERKLDFLRLSVFPENDRGIKFYENQGLKETMKTMECRL
jgi:ribosomal protein S18 acetylase RimI-like enzyme